MGKSTCNTYVLIYILVYRTNFMNTELVRQVGKNGRIRST
jgi:hypothetical protein